MTYAELRELPAEAYLDPSRFNNGFDDAHPRIGAENYEKGLKTGRAAKTIHIAVNSVWGASMLDGSSISSYTGIGYHTGTAGLLRGFIDSGCEILVHRDRTGESFQTIKIQ